MTYNIFSTETWRIQIPTNWSQRDCSAANTSYFESSDGTKGAYFSTWCFRDDPRSARELLESFRRVEVRSLHELKDYFWQSVGEWSVDRPELCVLGADFLDRRARYRIATHLVARLPWMVRSTFHDYDCADYESSKRFFQ